ncbi:MAG TPA: hypothetical protein VN812_04880 [Candidatus Acidoferrales bacterium]|nr:hypothetical protein [Candidatus Acidoferrales bacterium]
MRNLTLRSPNIHLTDAPPPRGRRLRVAPDPAPAPKPKKAPRRPSAPAFDFDAAVDLAARRLHDYPALRSIVDELYATFPMTRWNAWNAITFALMHREEPPWCEGQA